MPFKSEAQRKFLYATNPKVAKKFSAHTPKGKKLPYKVKQASKVKAFFRGLLKRGRENPAQTVAMLVLPGAGVAVPAAHAVKAANKKFGQSVGQPMARAMQKNPDYKNSVLRGILKTGSLEKSAAKKSLVSSLLKGGNEEAFKALNATNQRIINSSWFDKLSHVSMAAMRDEMSEIVGKHKTAEANINKAWSSLAKTAFATAPLSTKPIDVNSKQPKSTKNAGAPKGAKGPRVASMSTGKRADPLNPSPVTNA